MPTEPLTGARYPASSAAPNVPQDIQNAVQDLADIGYAGPHASTTARDSAFSAWVALGNTMRNGLHCHVTGVGDQVYLNSNWQTMTSGAQWGTTTCSLSSANIRTGTVTYPFVFATAPSIVLLTVQVDVATGIDLIAVLTNTPGTSSFNWRVRERAGTTVTTAAVLHWMVIP